MERDSLQGRKWSPTVCAGRLSFTVLKTYRQGYAPLCRTESPLTRVFRCFAFSLPLPPVSSGQSASQNEKFVTPFAFVFQNGSFYKPCYFGHVHGGKALLSDFHQEDNPKHLWPFVNDLRGSPAPVLTQMLLRSCISWIPSLLTGQTTEKHFYSSGKNRQKHSEKAHKNTYNLVNLPIFCGKLLPLKHVHFPFFSRLYLITF